VYDYYVFAIKHKWTFNVEAFKILIFTPKENVIRVIIIALMDKIMESDGMWWFIGCLVSSLH